MTQYLVTVTVTVETIGKDRDDAKIEKSGEFTSDHAAGQIALDVTRKLTDLIDETLIGPHEVSIGVPVR